VRILLVHHINWSINSACHIWGHRPYQTDDESRNNWVFGYLAMGEGWHNMHHAFPTSARHGMGWWQLDMSFWEIHAIAALHLALNMRLPTKEAQTQKRGAS
jgi:stearoyl-CoA desaturase (delta-9 desaturase)